MNTAENLSSLISTSLRTLLSETMFRAPPQSGFLLNPGDPGLVDTLKSLSAKTVSTPPGPGRKPIVSHANHVLYGLELTARAAGGDAHAFDNADWDAAWKLVAVNDAEWADLLARLERTAQTLLDAGPKFQPWSEIMLTGLFGSAAHTAYHLGAIRQMLADLHPERGA
jgi:hypothetical protein